MLTEQCAALLVMVVMVVMVVFGCRSGSCWQREPPAGSRATTCRGTSDTGVAAWRTWLSKFGREMPVLPRKLDDLPPLMDRRQSLDR